jgi:D-amino-acid dehydrogenase
MYRGLDTSGASFWMGFRPSMPDSLPVISGVPGNERAFIACGHGHLGMTFGAVTGLMIRDLVLGKGASEAAPFTATRF